MMLIGVIEARLWLVGVNLLEKGESRSMIGSGDAY